MEGDLTASYARVHKDFRKYRKRFVISIFVLYAGLIALAFDSFLLPFAVATHSNLLSYSLIGAVGLCFIVISVLIISRLERPTTEQRLFMRTYRALSCLTNYLQDSSKVKQRDLCKNKLRQLIPRIDLLWSIESSLERELLAPVAELKENLRNKILYSVEDGSVEDMRKSYNILARLARFFLQDHPNLPEVEVMNKSAKDLPERPEGKENLILRFLRWVAFPERFRILVAILSGPAFYVSARLGGVSFDVAFGAATVVAIGLLTPFLTIYLSQGRAGKKPKEESQTQSPTGVSSSSTGDVPGQDDQGVHEEQNNP